MHKTANSYLLSGGIQQDEFGQQLHYGKPDQWNNISLGQKVSEKSTAIKKITNHSKRHANFIAALNKLLEKLQY